jgi:hypothetical protein
MNLHDIKAPAVPKADWVDALFGQRLTTYQQQFATQTIGLQDVRRARDEMLRVPVVRDPLVDWDYARDQARDFAHEAMQRLDRAYQGLRAARIDPRDGVALTISRAELQWIVRDNHLNALHEFGFQIGMDTGDPRADRFRGYPLVIR